MDTKKSSFYMFSLATVVFCTVLISSVLTTGQPASTHHAGVVDDWSFHHIIFSNPGTYEQAIASGTYSKWLKIQYDTRYILQQMKRNAAPRVLAGPARRPLNRDWSMDLGPGAAVGTGQFPAKYSFDITTAYCDSDPAPDFAVYNTGLAGTAGTSATGTVTIATNPSGSGWAGATVTIGATTYTFVNTTPSSAGEVRRYTSSSLAAHNEDRTAQNLNAAINQTATCYGGGSACYDVTAANASVTATVAANVVTLTAITPGLAGNSIPLDTNYAYGFFPFPPQGGIELNGTTSPSENEDTTLGVGTGTPGANGQASMIAYDNLYSGCPTGRVPLVYWQYNTGGTVVTSSVISLDGSQLAFVQSNASNVASLVLLKWSKSSTLATLTNTPAGSYRSCAAPCMTSITFSGSPNDTNSSPSYDYSNDVAYIGDDSGVLHKFTNLFLSGTPAEITGGGTSSGWPQTMSAGNKLTSPAYDFDTGNVFVGSSGGKLSYIPAGGASTGGGSANIVMSGDLADTTNGVGIVDSALVDPVAAVLYVFVGDDGDAGHGSCNFTHPCSAAVWELSTSFTAGSVGTEERLGGTSDASNTNIVYGGTPDNILLNSAVGTGNLYACVPVASTGIPTLYQIPIITNALSTPNAGPALATASTGCSPVTEFYNTIDYLFLSVQNHGQNTLGAGSAQRCGASHPGCVMSFDVTSGAALTVTTSPLAAAAEAGGTSGIIIDNMVGSGTLAGASQVYFSTLANQYCTGNGATGSGMGGCAVQAPQSGL